MLPLPGAQFGIFCKLVSSSFRLEIFIWVATDRYKLCSNYATFFEKVVIFLEKIGLAFGEYDFLCKVFKNEEPEDTREEAGRARAALKTLQEQQLVEFETAICDFYTDLFEFFRRVVQIFRKSDGSECLCTKYTDCISSLMHIQKQGPDL